MMISLLFLYLCLFSYAHSRDEPFKQRIIRAWETNSFTWPVFDWGSATTSRTQTTTIIASAESSSSSFTTFQNEALAQTNKYRAKHCAPNLVLNATLNSIAQAYANKLASIRNLVHSNNNNYGENLYSFSSSQTIDINFAKGSTAIDSWYNEVNQYNWASSGFSSATGHFTQVVWIATRQFGIGIACTSDKKACYIVANYSPPGNYGGQYQANVKKGSSCT